MTLQKQFLLTAIVVAVTALLAARHSSDARTMLSDLGVPDTMIAAVAKPEADDEAGRGARGGGARAALVTTAPVSIEATSVTARAVGSGEARQSVSVVPLVSGALTQVAVTSGDVVAVGDLLARLNSDTEEITRDRAAVTLRSAEIELERSESLSQANATSQTELDTLRASRDDAALALREAEVALDQRSITSPIGGTVGIVPVEVGDYVTTASEIAMIDDRSELLVDFWLPELFVSKVALGQPVTLAPLALPGATFTGTVSAIASRIETDSRTLQVRATVANAEDRLRPGMSFSVSMTFEGQPYPSVDPLAVQWDSDGSYVWVVSDGVAVRTAAEIVQRNTDAVLIKADIDEATQVVTEGTLNVRADAPVTVQGATPPGEEGAAGPSGARVETTIEPVAGTDEG